MAGKTLSLENIITPDQKATRIANKWLEWDQMRWQWKQQLEDVRRYVFQTNTSQTANSALPWKNKTTRPKLCQIRDNLYANLSHQVFPKRKWMRWEGASKDDDTLAKRMAIENYAAWVTDQPSFKHEFDKILLDYIEGNAFGTVEWIDERVEQEGKTQVGFVGPRIRRINPMDIVFNPIAPSFEETPKIIRSFISMGELRKHLSSNFKTPPEEIEEMFKYMKDIRSQARNFTGELSQMDNLYNIDGFHSFREYLDSDVIEVLTFYGDLYDPDTDEFLENHIITVVDRHKIVGQKPNPSFFGYAPIFHCAWRKRQDNLWGMGALDNLLGLQYRLDHVENLKADVFDLITFPVIHVKGPSVEDFNWGPGERIFTDVDSEVEMKVPDVNALQANFEIDALERTMEEMAGAPKEALGIRTPGEKTAFEVSRLENASSRLYFSKGKQLDEGMTEKLMNACIEMARRNLSHAMSIRVFDDEFKSAAFQELTVEDITGVGRLRPLAARHFAEQAELVQNLTTFSQSPAFQLIAPHVSTVNLAKLFEEILNLHDYEIITPYVGIAEQAEAARTAQTLEEQVLVEGQTASGMGTDYDADMAPPGMQQSAAIDGQQMAAQEQEQ